jgi:phage/plasmid-like protein (TIGR03299 family)
MLTAWRFRGAGPIRVVCHNTLTMALQEGDKAIRVPHTRDVKERLEVARQNLKLINTSYEQIERDITNMAKVGVDVSRLATYLKLVFPDPLNSKDRRELDRVEKNRTRARELFTSGKGNSLPGVAGTLWAAYNGITEMVDHGRNRRTSGQHLDYIWFGGGYSLKVRAFELAKNQMQTLWRPEIG